MKSSDKKEIPDFCFDLSQVNKDDSEYKNDNAFVKFLSANIMMRIKWEYDPDPKFFTIHFIM